ncbi:MAG: efflux RND transporter periplasmic adaptor subunit [Bryobacterales bacterium]|nr:efflux RND transporter periplasmic adaptor subunit [Bryobacterales bacterium]
MKKIKAGIGVLIVLAAGWFFAMRVRQASQIQEETAKKAASKKGGARVVSVSTGEARTGQLRQEILLTGALRPKEQVEVTAKATGRVEKVTHQLGDRVKSGELIAELEDDELQQQVSRAKAALAVVDAAARQRKAELDNSKANLGRAESLWKEGLIPKSDLESRQTAMEVVLAQLQLTEAQRGQAQAEINELQIRLAQTKIYAPMAGHVAKRHIDQGALVSPSTPIMTLVNLNTMVTMASVPEQEVGKLRVGNRAKIEVDAFSDRAFEGRVARISPVLDAATRSAIVEVEIPNAELGLRAEMFARVHLDLGATREAVLIPREGLVYRGSQPGVFLIERNAATFRAIETGRTLGDEVEVLAHLDPGTTIITRGSSMLREGDQIKVTADRTSRAAPGKTLNEPPRGEPNKRESRKGEGQRRAE